MMENVDKAINDVMVDGHMTIEGNYNLQFKFVEMHDAQFGGHFIWDKEDCNKAWDFVVPIFGDGENMTREQFM